MEILPQGVTRQRDCRKNMDLEVGEGVERQIQPGRPQRRQLQQQPRGELLRI